MTVWTPVSLQEANRWLAMRRFEKARAITPIEEGVEDSVFRIELISGENVCLRLFERTEAAQPLALSCALADQGLPSCAPLKDFEGKILLSLKEKPAALFPWIEGRSTLMPSLEQIEEIGSFLGRMAQAGQTIGKSWKRPNPFGWTWFDQAAQKVTPHIDRAAQKELNDELTLQKKFWCAGKSPHVPRGPIHADLFRTNVLFSSDGHLRAVLDWGFCASDEPFIYDLAIVANDWCLDDNGYEMVPKKISALLRGREKFLPLTEKEQEAWPMTLRLAALRFYLSRLYDFVFRREEDGKSLPPEQFRHILQERQKI